MCSLPGANTSKMQDMDSTTGIEMTDLEFALDMLKTAMLSYARCGSDPARYDNMVFWQNQCWECVKEQVKGERQ